VTFKRVWPGKHLLSQRRACQWRNYGRRWLISSNDGPGQGAGPPMNRSVPWNPSAVTPRDEGSRAQPDNSHRALQTAACSLCGIELPIGLMVPDGGRTCADLRWYCKDAKSCTERWTARPRRSARPPAPAADDPPEGAVAEAAGNQP